MLKLSWHPSAMGLGLNLNWLGCEVGILRVIGKANKRLGKPDQKSKRLFRVGMAMRWFGKQSNPATLKSRKLPLIIYRVLAKRCWRVSAIGRSAVIWL